MAELDGIWNVERRSGVLPPLIGVRKRIAGDRGETLVGPLLRLPFDVRGRSLRYRGVLRGLVDELEPAGDGVYSGRATLGGRPLGTFVMRRK